MFIRFDELIRKVIKKIRAVPNESKNLPVSDLFKMLRNRKIFKGKKGSDIECLTPFPKNYNLKLVDP